MTRTLATVVGKELLGALMLAYCRGAKAGEGVIGTEHVLVTLAKRMQVSRAPVLALEREFRLRARGERSWDSADAGADVCHALGGEVTAALREAGWAGRIKLRLPWGAEAPVWSGAVRAAVAQALQWGEKSSVRWAHPAHLFAGVCADRGNRAAELHAAVGLDPEPLVSRLGWRVMRQDGTASSAGVGLLDRTGALAGPDPWVVRALMVLIRADAARWRPGGYLPLVMAVEREAARQAVRLGARQVDQTHLLLAVYALHSQLAQIGACLRPRWRAHSHAGELLEGAGVSEEALRCCADRLASPEPELAPVRPWRGRVVSDPPFARSVADVADGAYAIAAQYGLRHAGTSHILLALLEHPSGVATRVLGTFGADVDRLATQTRQAGYGGG